MFETIVAGVAHAWTLEAMTAVVVGVLIGQFCGALPGITVSTAMVLVLPFSFLLESTTAWGLFVGVYIGGMTGGSMPAIMLNIPGTPSSSATVLEGYPLAQRGEGGLAIGTAVLASTVGSFVSLICLVLIAPQLARVAIHFRSQDLAAVILFAIMIISTLGGKSPLKGLIAGILGLILGTVGLDPILGIQRFTFNFVDLQVGFPFLPVMVGLFAIPQVLIGLGNKRSAMETAPAVRIADILQPLKPRRFRPMAIAMIAAALVGVSVGIVPGLSAPIAVFLAYRYLFFLRKKQPVPSAIGVAIPEAANNGVTGGALVPLLTLGIPGDTVTAILLGAFLIQGIFPGPVLFTEHADLVYAIFFMFFVGVLVNYPAGVGMAKLVLRAVRLPHYILWPIIAVLCVVGTFAISNSLYDVGITIAFGIIGYWFLLYGFDPIPLVLGLMLGPIFENYFRTAVITSGGDWSSFLTRPVSLVFIALSLMIMIIQLYKSFRQSAKVQAA